MLAGAAGYNTFHLSHKHKERIVTITSEIKGLKSIPNKKFVIPTFPIISFQKIFYF